MITPALVTVPDEGSEVNEVTTGVWAVRVPMPEHPLRASFCYVYAGGDGSATVIDPGWPTETSWDSLVASLGSIGVDPSGIRSILLTHGHRDHGGLAGRLASLSGAPVALHADDHALSIRDEAQHRARVAAWLGLVGAGQDDAAGGTQGRRLPALPESVETYTALRDGDVIDVPGGELIVHWTPGHTPGHVCFEDRARGLLFSGDHLLPRITPNISAMVGHRDSALGDYLDSLTRLRDLRVELVLPGHEYAFTDHGERIDELVEHHRKRLREIVELLVARSTWSTYDVTQALTWSRPWGSITGLQRRAALGEVLAHLYFLESVAAVRSTSDARALAWTLTDASALEHAWSSAGLTQTASR